MSKISVLMPVYNTPEEYLREAIESILNQTFRDFEFLILDDGSTNNAAEVVKSYSDERIRYFYHKNEGISKTLNWGLELAQGEYIARMDSDDISLPERFEKQVAFLEENPDISLVGSWVETFPHQSILKYPAKVGCLDLLQECCLAHPAVMWRKADFEKYELKYNSEIIAQDYGLWSRAVQYIQIANVQKCLLKYRRHQMQITQTKEARIQQEDAIIKQNMLDFLTDKRWLQEKIQKLLLKKQTIKLFNLIPLIVIRRRPNAEIWRLFGFIPVFRKRRRMK